MGRSQRTDGILLVGEYIGIIDAFLKKAVTTHPPPTDLMEDFFAASQAKDLQDKRTNEIAEAMLQVDEGSSNASGISAFRIRVNRTLNLPKVQWTILCLIAIDVILGFASIAVDISIDDEVRKSEIDDAMWPVAMIFLCIFEVEILLQWYATGLFSFFHHPGFILDLVIITVSLGLEAARLQGIPQILTVLRAWRVARVFNVAKVSLKKEITELKKDMVIRDAELRKCKRLIKGLRFSEEKV